MFCNRSYRQLAGAIWLSLYYMKCKRPVIALLYHQAVAIVVEAIVGETTTMLRWRSRCRASDDGDHDGASKMVITSTRWWWPYHITYIDCMWCLSFMHLIFALIDGSIIRWSLTKFQGISILPEYAPLRKFFVLRHHVMIGCDRLYIQIQWVQNSCTHGILSFNLTSLAYNRYGLGTRRPKGRAWII